MVGKWGHWVCLAGLASSHLSCCDLSTCPWIEDRKQVSDPWSVVENPHFYREASLLGPQRKTGTLVGLQASCARNSCYLGLETWTELPRAASSLEEGGGSKRIRTRGTACCKLFPTLCLDANLVCPAFAPGLLCSLSSAGLSWNHGGTVL